ncbi:threonine dehydratase, partial [Burkholderia seminalis]|nr:threonine dehydratase [Burkholderia seminalis]
IQVPEADRAAFDHFLSTLGYPSIEEGDNLAYRLFL